MATTHKRIGFFGPFGTFTEQALRTQADLVDAELVPFYSVPDVLDAVAKDEIDAGFVPIKTPSREPSTSLKMRSSLIMNY